ncbi:MAG TPA: hypothetical protein VFA17_08135 [Thermoplasmata archaeon]|nr:hypothetical protein [Thermoplasmata archaeon]
MGPILHVVGLDAASNLSTRLLWASLQGLVNRVQVELYVDFGGDPANRSATLADWEERYAIAYDNLSADAALARYAPRWNGTIVYDPSRPESINIGTMLAAQRGALLVGPDLAGWMQASYGLAPRFDYATSDWAPLDRIGAYNRALRELYPASNPSLLAMLPPDRWAIRDYLIATRTFVFYLPQGILASPFDVAATTRILDAAPRGIPVLGWFDSPTLTEENAFVQALSRAGKFSVGVQHVPNLSVMTALGRTFPHRQFPPPAAGRLANTTYVVLAIPDGDNLDFLAGRMHELWTESVRGVPVRGTVPIAWSVSPLLVDLAPPLLDAYYRSATPADRLIAGPSGAGYLYPDYALRDDLESFVAFSGRYMQAAGLDVLWLLNAFPATEIPYSDASLQAYVDGVRPRGIVLDYADQPRSRDAWMEVGEQAVAPVIRSTHFWTTQDNVLGKLAAAAATWDRGPHFVWLTVYSFRFGLGDALRLIDTMKGRLPGGVEVVSPEAFFSFLRLDFVRQETERLRSVEVDPIASLVFRGTLDAARRHSFDADVDLGAGDVDGAATAAYLGLEALREIRAAEALFLSALVLLAAAGLAVQAQRADRPTPRPSGEVRVGPLVFLIVTIAMFLLALREAVDQNFWTYPAILIGVAVAGLHRPLRRLLDRAWGVRTPAIAALLDLVFVTLAIRTSAAFPLALVGTLVVLDAYLSRRPATNVEALAGLCFGTAIGFAGGFDLVTMTLFSVLLVVSSVGLRTPAPIDSPRPRSRTLLRGILLTLPLTALAIAFSYSLASRLEVQGDRLVPLAAGFLVVPPVLAILIRRMIPPISARTGILAGLGFAGALGAAVLAVVGTIPTTLLLLGLFTSLSFAALAALDQVPPGGIAASRALPVAVALLPPLLLFLRVPSITFSLVLVPLPEPIEYALYAAPALVAGTSLALFLFILFRERAWALVEKHYPRGRHRRAGGP